MSAPSLFGVILPSRPVQTTPLVVSPTQFAFTFPSNPTYSHIIVFLLPGIALPDSTLAAIYAQLPGPIPEFKLLGALSNEKQSAIFKVDSGNGKSAFSINGVRQEDDMIDDDVDVAPGIHDTPGDTTIGISVEPAATILPQLANLHTTKGPSNSSSSALVPSTIRSSSAAPTTKVLAQRIINNAFNFLASFAGTMVAGGEEVVPLRSFRDWWVKFESRIENDPGFLERDGNG